MTYKESLHRIWLIAKREAHRLVARPVYFFCMLIAPVICVIFFVSLMREGLPTDLPIAVVDMDNSATSRDLIRRLDAFEQTEVYMKTMSFTEARQEMQKGNVYGIFYIPSGFAVDATSGKQPRLSFYTNGTYLIAASLLFRDMKTMSVLAGAAVGLQTGQAKGYTEAQIMGQLQPIVIDTHPIGNPWLNYSVYLNNTVLPGIIQLMVFLVTVFSIGTEIKYSTSRKWLDMGGNSRWSRRFRRRPSSRSRTTAENCWSAPRFRTAGISALSRVLRAGVRGDRPFSSRSARTTPS